MATKGYVVSEGDFSYDDNYYSSTEGGHPNKIFLEKDQAEEYAEELGIESFKDLVENDIIFEYGYGDIDSVFHLDDEFEEFIKEKMGTTPEDWWDRRYSGTKPVQRYGDNKDGCLQLSDDDWKKFYGFCSLNLSYVKEVEFGGVFS